jgi:hypothetical protein
MKIMLRAAIAALSFASTGHAHTSEGKDIVEIRRSRLP